MSYEETDEIRIRLGNYIEPSGENIENFIFLQAERKLIFESVDINTEFLVIFEELMNIGGLKQSDYDKRWRIVSEKASMSKEWIKEKIKFLIPKFGTEFKIVETVKVGDPVILVPSVPKISQYIKPQSVVILEISPDCIKKVDVIEWETFRDRKEKWRALVRSRNDDKETGYWMWGYELLPLNWREKYKGLITF